MLLLLLFLLSSAAGWFRSPKSRRLLSSWSTNRQSINRRHCPVQSSCLFLVCFLGPADCRRVASEREKWKKRNHSKKKILIGFQSCVSLFFLFFFPSYLFLFRRLFIFIGAFSRPWDVGDQDVVFNAAVVVLAYVPSHPRSCVPYFYDFTLLRKCVFVSTFGRGAKRRCCLLCEMYFSYPDTPFVFFSFPLFLLVFLRLALSVGKWAPPRDRGAPDDDIIILQRTAPP